MLNNSAAIIPLAAGVLLGIVAFVIGLYVARRRVERARAEAAELVADARQEAESSTQELRVATQERLLTQQEEIPSLQFRICRGTGPGSPSSRRSENLIF